MRTPGQMRGMERVQVQDIRRTERTCAEEAEESPLLTSITRKRLLKTLWTGDDLVFAAVICKVWKSAIAM
jgi:hypothetical protein